MGRFVQNQPSEENNAEESKLINIRIGVFFDGTSNNKLNINEYLKPEENRSWFRKRKDDLKWAIGMSYKSDFSNVAKLSDFYNQEKKGNEFYTGIYIEGIATAPREKDTDPGGFDSYAAAATGMGEYGINGKVERACGKVIENIQEILRKKENSDAIGVGTLRLDVFGFSRGAAAARRFVSCIEQASGDFYKDRGGRFISVYHVSLRKMITQKKMRVDKIKPCFMGLFDTVSSYGFNFKDDVKELTLDVSKPEMVIQLVAADEYRKNFALTRIKTARGKSKEFILPGEHCDIGGSQINGISEKTILRQEQMVAQRDGFIHTIPAVYNGYKTLEQLLEEGWIKSKDEKKRSVSNEYSVIPLLLMHKYKKELFTNRLVKKNNVDDIEILQKFKERIDQIENQPMYEFSGADPEEITPLFKKGNSDFTLLKNIRHSYLHLSAQGGLVNSPAKNNIRLIIDDSK